MVSLINVIFPWKRIRYFPRAFVKSLFNDLFCTNPNPDTLDLAQNIFSDSTVIDHAQNMKTKTSCGSNLIAPEMIIDLPVEVYTFTLNYSNRDLQTITLRKKRGKMWMLPFVQRRKYLRLLQIFVPLVLFNANKSFT